MINRDNKSPLEQSLLPEKRIQKKEKKDFYTPLHSGLKDNIGRFILKQKVEVAIPTSRPLADLIQDKENHITKLKEKNLWQVRPQAVPKDLYREWITHIKAIVELQQNIDIAEKKINIKEEKRRLSVRSWKM